MIDNMGIILILVFGYLFTFITATLIVRTSINLLTDKNTKEKKNSIVDTGFMVGLCENFIIITFILINEIQSLAIIFSAKTIVRYKGISEKPQYYLAGTMINFSYSVFMAFVIKIFIS